MKIGIINNSLGNVGSVQSALEFYKYQIKLVKTPEAIEKSDILVLAGVGNFKTAVSKLRRLNLWDKLNEEVIENKKPILGICLGMQLFADFSYEGGKSEGFGWISGEVKKIDESLVRVPHIGWNVIEPKETNLFSGMRYGYFYYMHSYQFIPDDDNVVLAYTTYGNLKIVATIKKDNILGVQFHPEKSQGDGLRLFKNIIDDFNVS